MSGRSRVLDETVAAIQALAGDPFWKDRGFLPGLREMARMAGCSHYTMWKAVKILEEKGLLEVRPGRRIRIPRPGDETAQAPQASENDDLQADIQYKWERLKRQIEMDIISGALRPGEALPTLKELGARYGASFLTLKKALRTLEVEGGLLRHVGAGAYAVVPMRPPPRSVLVYLAWGDTAGQLKFGTPFDHEILGSLGNECARVGIRLEKVVFMLSGDKLLFHHGRKTTAAPPDICREAFAFLVRTVCTRDVVPDLVSSLAALGKPVAVLDEMGSPHFPKLHGRYPNLAVFRHTISGTPARQMGAHLAAQGHKEVAFLSPFHATAWSANRLASLRECFRALGPSFRVHPFTLELDYRLPGEGGEDGGLVEVLLGSLGKAARSWKAAYPPLAGILEKSRMPLNSLVWQGWVQERMAPVFEQALRRKEISAWVAADDDTALLAMEFLRRKGLRPPRDVSLVGFDDTAEGARVDLTSYNFDFPRFFHGVLLRLLDPPALSSVRGRQPIEIEGRIVERGSSARIGSAHPGSAGGAPARGAKRKR